MSGSWRLGVALVAAVVAVALGGCGSSGFVGTSPYCGTAGCATVTGRVERCDGPALSRCRAARVPSVSLMTARGQLATADHAGGRRTLESYSLLIDFGGRYTLEATIGGKLVRRAVTLRLGHTTHANLIGRL